METDLRLALALVLLTGLAVGLLTLADVIGFRRQVAVAAGRAAVQLAVISSAG